MFLDFGFPRFLDSHLPKISHTRSSSFLEELALQTPAADGWTGGNHWLRTQRHISISELRSKRSRQGRNINRKHLQSCFSLHHSAFKLVFNETIMSRNHSAMPSIQEEELLEYPRTPFPFHNLSSPESLSPVGPLLASAGEPEVFALSPEGTGSSYEPNEPQTPHTPTHADVDHTDNLSLYGTDESSECSTCDSEQECEVVKSIETEGFELIETPRTQQTIPGPSNTKLNGLNQLAAVCAEESSDSGRGRKRIRIESPPKQGMTKSEKNNGSP